MHDVIHAKRERRKREKESAPQAVFIKKKKRKDSPSFLHCVDECLLLFFSRKQKREKKKTGNEIIILSLSFLLEGMDILPFSIDGSHYASPLSSFLLLKTKRKKKRTPASICRNRLPFSYRQKKKEK